MSKYSELLKHPKWQKKRLEILNRDKFKCVLCKDEESQLQIHHLEYIGSNPWDTPNAKLKTLCCHCHEGIEFLKSYPIFTFPLRAKKFINVIAFNISDTIVFYDMKYKGTFYQLKKEDLIELLKILK